MGFLNDLLRKVEQMDIDAIAGTGGDAVLGGESVLEFNEDALVKAQQDQFWHGENAEGKMIGQLRSEEYANEKEKKTMAPYGYADLRDTEQFYKSIYAFSTPSGEIELDAPVQETARIEISRWEENGQLFGLNEQWRAPFVKKDLMPDFKAVITSQIGLRFGKQS